MKPIPSLTTALLALVMLAAAPVGSDAGPGQGHGRNSRVDAAGHHRPGRHRGRQRVQQHRQNRGFLGHRHDGHRRHHRKEVRWVKSTKLVATIDVADTAVVNKFDIEVTLDSGRKGKGTTLFSVLKKAVAALDPCLTSSPQGGVVNESTFPSFAFFRSTQRDDNRVDWSIYILQTPPVSANATSGSAAGQKRNMRYDSATDTALIVNVGPLGLVGTNVPITFSSTTGPATGTLLDPPPTLLNVF